MEQFDLDYDLDEALIRQKINKNDLEMLRYPQIPGVPVTITDKQLILFLDSCGCIDDARKVLKIYYDARRDAPEYFLNRDPLNENIQKCFQAQYYINLPSTPDGLEVIYHRLSDINLPSYNYEDSLKTFFMTIDYCLNKKGPRNGIIFLYDMKGVTLGHLTRCSITSLRKFVHYLQNGLPAKLNRIHILNVTTLFDTVLYFLKPMMSAEVAKMINTHKTDMDYNEFYKLYIPKCCLPSDYGGDLLTVNELHQIQVDKMIELRDYYILEEKQRVVV